MNKHLDKAFSPHEIQWNSTKIQHLWDYYGSSDAHKLTYFGEMAGKHLVRIIRRLGLLRNSKSIVDFSCGTGAVIEAILKSAPTDATVTGYDPSKFSIEKTNSRNHRARGFHGAYQITEYPTNINSESVDVLLMTEVIEHLDDYELQIILSECRRILSPTGRLVLTTPNNENLAKSQVICPECGCIFHRWQHLRSWDEASLTLTLKKHGFKKITARKVAWGNELIDLAFSILGKKKTGIFIVACKN